MSAITTQIVNSRQSTDDFVLEDALMAKFEAVMTRFVEKSMMFNRATSSSQHQDADQVKEEDMQMVQFAKSRLQDVLDMMIPKSISKKENNNDDTVQVSESLAGDYSTHHNTEQEQRLEQDKLAKTRLKYKSLQWNLRASSIIMWTTIPIGLILIIIGVLLSLIF